MTLQLSKIREWLGLPQGNSGGAARGYSIDSRTVQPGDLFFAIRGPRNDGHDYVPAALRRGAVAAVVEPSYRGAGEQALVPADDTGVALRTVAAKARQEWGRTVIAVTGSGGKTTTKDVIAALLGESRPVAKSEGNLNNEYGLPLSLLRVPAEAHAAVVEIGINHAGEMRPLAGIAAPDIGVVTNVGSAHLGNFASVDEIGREKGQLIESLSEGGTAILNADDPRVSGFRSLHSGRTVTFGIDRAADIRAEDVEELGADGIRFRLAGNRMVSALPGRHSVYNILAAIAAVRPLGIGPERLPDAVARLRPTAMRGIVRKAGGVTVIDDCYNANPSAMAAMLEVLRRTDATRRIAVLGEMRELGERSRELHRQVGMAVALAGVDYLVAVGGDAAQIADSAGVPAEFHDSPAAAARFLTRFVRAGDAVLIKASRGVGLERLRDPLFEVLSQTVVEGTVA